MVTAVHYCTLYKVYMISIQVEDSMERERKGKGEVERSRRKVEGDLKLAQELIVDKERYKIYITLYKIL